VGVFAHHSHVDTSHKEKKMQKTILHPAAQETHNARVTMQRKKRKEEGRRKKGETHGTERPATETLRWVSPAVGLRDPQFFFFFFNFPFGDLGKDLVERKKPTAGSCGKDLTRDQTHRSDPPRSKSTTGHRDPWLGLAGVGLVFFFFFLPVGLIFFFFFFLVFRMIKFQIGLTFPSRF
jgi:hypothetical protein